MAPLKPYEGVVRGDLVVLNGRPALPDDVEQDDLLRATMACAAREDD